MKRHETFGTATHLDLRDGGQVSRAIDRVAQELGPIHIFVSNARTEITTFYSDPFNITDEHWTTALDTQPTAFLHGKSERVS